MCVQYTRGLHGMQICAGPTGATVIASTGAVLIAISHEPVSFTVSLCSLQYCHIDQTRTYPRLRGWCISVEQWLKALAWFDTHLKWLPTYKRWRPKGLPRTWAWILPDFKTTSFKSWCGHESGPLLADSETQVHGINITLGHRRWGWP